MSTDPLQIEILSMSQLSYAAAGVSIDAGDELVERIKPFA